jgi:hypothetical protein
MSEEEALGFLRKEDSDAPLEPDSWRQIGIVATRDNNLVGDIGIPRRSQPTRCSRV